MIVTYTDGTTQSFDFEDCEEEDSVIRLSDDEGKIKVILVTSNLRSIDLR